MWLKWDTGRAGTGYWKMKLLESVSGKFDLYLLKYPKGSFINWHTDPTFSGFNHWRLNLVLWRTKGGEFETRDACKVKTSRLNIFRPDVNEHRVTTIESGTRYVLSLGWLTKAYNRVTPVVDTTTTSHESQSKEIK
jgi:hypothetical protein